MQSPENTSSFHHSETGSDGFTDKQRGWLTEKGFTVASEATDMCGGNRALADCPTATELVPKAAEHARNLARQQPEGTVWSSYGDTSRRCGSCMLACTVSAETIDGMPTGRTRLITAPSSSIEGDVVVVDARAYQPPVRITPRLNAPEQP